jgi:hypothetical protein
MKKMNITIDKDGKTSIQVGGARVDECLEFTKLVEKAVGEVKERTLTEDYHKEVQEGIDIDISESENL